MLLMSALRTRTSALTTCKLTKPSMPATRWRSLRTISSTLYASIPYTCGSITGQASGSCNPSALLPLLYACMQTLPAPYCCAMSSSRGTDLCPTDVSILSAISWEVGIQATISDESTQSMRSVLGWSMWVMDISRSSTSCSFKTTRNCSRTSCVTVLAAVSNCVRNSRSKLSARLAQSSRNSRMTSSSCCCAGGAAPGLRATTPEALSLIRAAMCCSALRASLLALWAVAKLLNPAAAASS
mmetsp:Transcript_34272/g.103463  ORF Transcript_34272/g.103463 Transcript_34272/m.103463 type:complete len:241 (+) Transcript_34272:479-1201(+)